MLAAKRRPSSRASGLLATHQPQELGFVNVAVFDEAGDQPKCLLAMLFQNDAGARVTFRLAGLFHRNAGVVPLCCRKPATKRARLLCAAADTSSLPYGHGVSPRSGFLAPAPPFCRGCFFGCGAVAMASDGRSLRRRRAHQKVVRLLYGKCCGQRGGCGRLRICCCWSSNRRGSETPQPRRQTASPGFTVGALFCRRLFGLFAQDYTGRWIHVVDLAARETGHRLINVVVLRDVLGNKALNALSG
jgi:hypothetical protein